MSDSEDKGVGALFEGVQEEDSLKPTYVDFEEKFTITPTASVTLKLTRSEPKHALWGNILWNGAKYFAEELLKGTITVKDKTVLEVGAGLGVPSMLCSANPKGSARTVVCSDYPEDAVVDLLKRNLDQNCGENALQNRLQFLSQPETTDGEVKRESSEISAPAPKPPICMGLLWGDEDQMAEALSHVGGNGFDRLILSDVLFNHVCHPQLAKTIAKCLSKDKNAVAHVLFTHYRPHKKEEDMAFFNSDLLSKYGLDWRHVNSQRCPLLFPEDPGNEEDRSTIHHYEVFHKFDAAGAPLDQTTYDVIVQGTGLVECLASASLARSGKKVLQVDPFGQYGGIHYTGNLPQFKNYLFGSADDDDSEEQKQEGFSAAVAPSKKKILYEESEAATAKCCRDFSIDLMPLLYLANSSLIDYLMESGTAKYVEFQNVERLLSINVGEQNSAAPEEGEKAEEVYTYAGLSRVPLKRADVFNHCKWLSPMEMRNLMKFVSVVEQRMKAEGEGLDSEEEREKEKKEKEGVAASGVAKETVYDGTFYEMLKKKFKLSQKSQDLLTLNSHLIGPAVSADDGVDIVGTFMSSVGRFEGETPFLVAQYGASELTQNMARVSAVWGSVFVLQRHITTVRMAGDSTHRKENDRVVATMSNGQEITAKQLIIPRKALNFVNGEGNSPSTELVRAVLVLKKPFISWEALQSKCNDTAEEEDEQRRREVWNVPEVIAVLKRGEGEDNRSAILIQYGGTSQHAPRGGTTVVHLIADATHAAVGGATTIESMEKLVTTTFLSNEKMKENTIFACIFEVGEEVLAGPFSIPTDSVLISNDTATAEGKRQQLQDRIIPVQTVFSGFDDGAMAAEAARAFKQVFTSECPVGEEDKLTLPPFLDYIPDHPDHVAIAENDDDARLLGVDDNGTPEVQQKEDQPVASDKNEK